MSAGAVSVSPRLHSLKREQRTAVLSHDLTLNLGRDGSTQRADRMTCIIRAQATFENNH